MVSGKLYCFSEVQQDHTDAAFAKPEIYEYCEANRINGGRHYSVRQNELYEIRGE